MNGLWLWIALALAFVGTVRSLRQQLDAALDRARSSIPPASF
jgi:hypothetical protein